MPTAPHTPADRAAVAAAPPRDVPFPPVARPAAGDGPPDSLEAAAWRRTVQAATACAPLIDAIYRPMRTTAQRAAMLTAIARFVPAAVLDEPLVRVVADEADAPEDLARHPGLTPALAGALVDHALSRIGGTSVGIAMRILDALEGCGRLTMAAVPPTHRAWNGAHPAALRMRPDGSGPGQPAMTVVARIVDLTPEDLFRLLRTTSATWWPQLLQHPNATPAFWADVLALPQAATGPATVVWPALVEDPRARQASETRAWLLGGVREPGGFAPFLRDLGDEPVRRRPDAWRAFWLEALRYAPHAAAAALLGLPPLERPRLAPSDVAPCFTGAADGTPPTTEGQAAGYALLATLRGDARASA